MPEFIRNLEEWIIWLLAEEFHQSSTIELIAQRTGFRQEDVLSAIANLERGKAIAVYRNAQQAMNIDHIRLVPPGMRTYEDLKKSRQALIPDKRLCCIRTGHLNND